MAELVKSSRRSPTEERHRKSRHLDKMPLAAAIRLMLAEEAIVVRRILSQTACIERVIEAIVRALRQGGRLLYVGAGTSGRLGVLDASECPATFRTRPQMVQGIIAGGEPALRKAVEGAEDDVRAGAEAMRSKGV